MNFEDSLDDVHTRFVLNLPPEELTKPDRLLFQMEQAWWFYEDHICDAMTDEEIAKGGYIRFPHLKPFAQKLFEYSPLLDSSQFAHQWQVFSDYKRKISTYGLILLDSTCTQMVLCQIWNGKTYTLPAGKINQGEDARDSAIRECYEETGFDAKGQQGLAAKMQSPHPWKLGEHALSYQEANGKRRTYYVCVGVPLDFPFSPVARKEIASVEWFELNALPKRSFAVLPIMGKLRHWIRKFQKKKGNRKCSTGRPKSKGRDGSKGRPNSRGKDRDSSKPRGRIQTEDDPLVDAGLAQLGDSTRWSAEEMFQKNQELTGRAVDYDGNPHIFAEKGFAGIDPHAFRVVGGGFMNSGDGLAPIATTAKNNYQPLTRSADSDALPLTPFFTSEGVTPWGEVVEEAASFGNANDNGKAPNPGEAILQMLQGGSGSKPEATTSAIASTKLHAGVVDSVKDDDDLDVLTDAQITAKSQARAAKDERMYQQYLEDQRFIQEWVKKLPNPIQFRIPNIDAIMAQHFGT